MLTHLLFFSAAFAEDLEVTSNVRGLSIVVNGVDTGKKTPATITGVAPGSAMIQVGDSCRAGSAMAEVAAGVGSRVNVRAEEQLATLTVAVKPAQAVVDVNGGKVTLSPNVPVGLPCGTYEITASLKGYSPASYSLELIGGQTLGQPVLRFKLIFVAEVFYGHGLSFSVCNRGPWTLKSGVRCGWRPRTKYRRRSRH